MQLSYSQTFDAAIEGMLVDSESAAIVDTALAVENIDFGRAAWEQEQADQKAGIERAATSA